MFEYPTIVYSFGPRARQSEGGDLTDEVISALAASDAPFEAVWDLCELAATHDPAVRRWAAASDLRIVGLAGRAVKWLFHAAGAKLPESAEVLDPETTTAADIAGRLAAAGKASGSTETYPTPSTSQSAEAMTVVLYEGPGAAVMAPERLAELVCSAVAAGHRVTRPGRGRNSFPVDTSAAAIVGEFKAGQSPAEFASGDGRVCIDASGKCKCGVVSAIDEARESLGLPRPAQWVPWFPVIDYDLCVGCNQCANFCIFGAYTTDGGVRVAHPASCKTNCPACARMCPKSAIIFPYYPTPPINGRAATAGTPEPVDLKQALQGDVYAVLRSRGQSLAGANGKPPTPAELARIASQVEIPAQVLESLGVSSPAPKTDCGCGCSEDSPACNCSSDETCDCDCSRDENAGAGGKGRPGKTED